jgi:hypothetical protein
LQLSVWPKGVQIKGKIGFSAWHHGHSERVWHHQYGATPMREPANDSTALATFIARKAEIDTILARLTPLSGEHFNRAPDTVSWGDAGTLGSYLY